MNYPKRKEPRPPRADAPYLTLPQVGVLACGYSRAYNAVRSGRLRGHRPNGPGSDYIFRREDVDAWLRGEAVEVA